MARSYGSSPDFRDQPDTRECSSCLEETEDWYVVLTAWQEGDTDSRDKSDEELLAEGARLLCLECVNEEEDEGR